MRYARVSASHTFLMAVLILVGLGSILMLAACGGSSTSDSTPAPSASSGATVTVAGASIASDPSLNAMLPDSIKSSGEMRVAMNIPYPPWEMYESEGSKVVTGFDWDLSQALAAKLGITAKDVQLPFDSLIPAVQADKADVTISALYDSKERQAVLDFVDYAYDGTTILVLKGNPKSIQGLDDLSGKSVIVVTGASQARMATRMNKEFKAAGKPEMKMVILPNSSDLTLALAAGKADASLTDLSAGAWAAKTYEDGNAFEIVLEPSAPNGYEPGLLGAGVVKGNTQLRDALQKALQALIDEGAYAKILDKYGIAPAAVESATVNNAAF